MAFHSQIDSHILQEGYLWKTGRLNKSFKRRYFVLYDDRTINYFAKKCHTKSRSKAKGTIYLTQIKRIEFVQYIPTIKSLLNSNINDNTVGESDNNHFVSNKNLNGYNIICDHNIISSTQPPPNYCCTQCDKDNNRFQYIRNRTRSLPPNPIILSPSSTETISEYDDEYDINIHQSLISPTNNNMNDMNLNNIISPFIDKNKNIVSRNEECKIFEGILKNTKLGLKCCRRYSFALIGTDRAWILSADNNQILKQWLSIFHKLCQYKPMLSGYLSLKYKKKIRQYFVVLYTNKLLNCYKDNKCVFDVDLRHLMWIKYDAKQLEIVTLNKNYTFLTQEHEINEWYNNICNLFCISNVTNNIYYDSFVCLITSDHNDSKLNNRYIALFKGYLVIFQNKKQLNLINKMTFFSYRMFADYLRNKSCIIIPLNNEKIIKIEEISNENCKYVFSVSHGDRKWYFYLQTEFILKQWMNLLFYKQLSLSPLELFHSKSFQEFQKSQFNDAAVNKGSF